MRGLIDHAIKVYGAHSFEGECAKENPGSARVMEKLGMAYDHDSTYTKNEGSRSFESVVYKLFIGYYRLDFGNEPLLYFMIFVKFIGKPYGIFV